MEQFFDDLAAAYRIHIEDADKEYHFLILVSFLVSWGFIRMSTHMIRAQVSWWPGNVETKGGTHIHHMFWGILLLLSMGYIGLSFTLGAPWIELVAVGFGIGMGLTLDEFALWLNLEDVYWAPKGRQSIDAVIATTALLVITLIGAQFWIDVYEAVLGLFGIGGDELDERGDHPVHRLLACPGRLLGVGVLSQTQDLHGDTRALLPDRRAHRGAAAGEAGLALGAAATGAFHCLITRVSRSKPRIESVPVPNANSAPASGSSPNQRAQSTRSRWP